MHPGDLANALTPPFPGLTKGSPGAGAGAARPVTYANAKARRVLGLEFRAARETYADMWADFAGRGWRGEATE